MTPASTVPWGVNMRALAASCASFLIAVLWFDLMFDVQTRNHDGATLPPDVLGSIASYYRRVTTDAAPMNRLISIVMLATLMLIAVELASGTGPAWTSIASLVFALGAIGIAAARTVRNAVELGRQQATSERQTALARAIYRDHLFCLAAMTAVALLQLAF